MRIHIPKKIWRIIIPILLLTGIIGPWWFDSISIPAQYACKPPIVRLDDDLCGVPTSGTFILLLVGSLIFQVSRDILTGNMSLDPTGLWQFSLFILFAIFLILPFVSTCLLIFKRERKSLHWLQIAALGIAGGITIYRVLTEYPLQISWVLWGIWLYAGVAVAGLVIEVLSLAISRKPRADQILAA